MDYHTKNYIINTRINARRFFKMLNSKKMELKKAVKLGILVDASETAKKTCIGSPLYITSILHSEINAVTDTHTMFYHFVLWDVLNQLYKAIKNKDSANPLSFTATIGEKMHVLWALYMHDEKENINYIIVMNPTDPIK